MGSNPYYEPGAELVPGTALPATGPDQTRQPENRGTMIPTPGSDSSTPGVSLFERLTARDDISVSEAHLVGAALRAFDRAPKAEKIIYGSIGDQTDPTTGNLVVLLEQIPQGSHGRITQVTVDAPMSATITPAAPYANALSFAYVAVLPPTSGVSDATAATSRAGLVAFAPTSAAGPILPGQWTFNEDEAPVAWGGEAVYFVLVGGSVAATLNLFLQVTYRINLYS